MKKQALLIADVLCINVTENVSMNDNDYDYSDGIPLDEWVYAIKVELEHGNVCSYTDVTGNDLFKTALIALAHINEYVNYYKRLKEMEEQLEKEKDKYINANVLNIKDCPVSSRKNNYGKLVGGKVQSFIFNKKTRI